MSFVVLFSLLLIAGGLLAKKTQTQKPQFETVPLDPKSTESAEKPQTPISKINRNLPPALNPFTEPEHFTPDTLYEKINGKADLYLEAGFENLHTCRYKSTANSELWAELYLYDMGTAANAFAVYSQQRRTQAEPVSPPSIAYKTENALFFITGPYYAEFIASESDPEFINTIFEFSAEIENTLACKDISNQLKEVTLLPRKNLQPQTITLYVKNVFGFEKLTDTYTAAYEIEGQQINVFITNADSTENAQQLMNDYIEFLKIGGYEPVELQNNHPDMKAFELFGIYEIVFTRGQYLAGIHESMDQYFAEQMAGELAKSLENEVNSQK